MIEEFESTEYEPKRWPKETVSMALRALNKVWYPMEDEYFYDSGLPSTILDTKELPLLLSDPDKIEDYALTETLSFFVGLIEGVDTVEDLYEFMREQQEMLVQARESQAARMGMDVQEMSQHRARIKNVLGSVNNFKP